MTHRPVPSFLLTRYLHLHYPEPDNEDAFLKFLPRDSIGFPKRCGDLLVSIAQVGAKKEAPPQGLGSRVEGWAGSGDRPMGGCEGAPSGLGFRV